MQTFIFILIMLGVGLAMTGIILLDNLTSNKVPNSLILVGMLILVTLCLIRFLNNMEVINLNL